MKRKAKPILYILFAIAMAVAVVAANVVRSNSLVKGVDTEIDYCGSDTLLLPHEIDTLVLSRLPQLTHKKLKEIDTRAIAALVDSNPYVASCKVSLSVGGTLQIAARQRVAVMHLFVGDEDLYFDTHGHPFPSRPDLIADAPIVTADEKTTIPQDFNTRSLEVSKPRSLEAPQSGLLQAWRLACFLAEGKEYGALFDQIYIEHADNLLLVPKVGNFVVEVGDAEDLERKFHNLSSMLGRGLPFVGWSRYSRISIKYPNQIVCTKRD